MPLRSECILDGSLECSVRFAHIVPSASNLQALAHLIGQTEFPRQFAGKSIRDKFEVGQDVDVTSRATISVRAAAREIRESARMVARAVLKPQDVR